MRCWAAALLCCCCTQAVEDPIGADAITYLDGSTWSWHRDDDGFTIPASVPGDVVTDLERAGAIGDPLLDDNFVRDAPVWRAWVCIPFCPGRAGVGLELTLSDLLMRKRNMVPEG